MSAHGICANILRSNVINLSQFWSFLDQKVFLIAQQLLNLTEAALRHTTDLLGWPSHDQLALGDSAPAIRVRTLFYFVKEARAWLGLMVKGSS